MLKRPSCAVIGCAAIAVSVLSCARSGDARFQAESRYVTFHGAGDASAAAALDRTAFVVADDEDNILRIYELGTPDTPAAEYDLSEFLHTGAGESEADIEAAAIIGQRVYWIASHDTSKHGEPKAGRDYFFATEITRQDDAWTLRPVGTPCRNLLRALTSAPVGKRLGLYVADPKRTECIKAANVETQKISIEGMCSSLDGKQLYLAFRQPLIEIDGSSSHRALVIPLVNPDQVVDSGATPDFGEPLLWDLGGRAIRGMERSHIENTILIVAGRKKGPDAFALYRWTGQESQSPELMTTLDIDSDQLLPESLVTFPEMQRILVISDDGDLMVPVGSSPNGKAAGYARNKQLTDPAMKRFRAVWIESERGTSARLH